MHASCESQHDRSASVSPPDSITKQPSSHISLCWGALLGTSCKNGANCQLHHLSPEEISGLKEALEIHGRLETSAPSSLALSSISDDKPDIQLEDRLARLQIDHADPHVALRKTKLCRHYQKNQCFRGDNCLFAHGDDDLAPLPHLRVTRHFSKGERTEEEDSQADGDRDKAEMLRKALKKSKLCSHYEKGQCERGNACHFVHMHGSEAQAYLDIAKGLRQCPHELVYSFCGHSKCAFSHKMRDGNAKNQRDSENAHSKWDSNGQEDWAPS